MQAIVVLELSRKFNLTPDQMKKDIMINEGQIGWAYYYKIKSIEVIENAAIVLLELSSPYNLTPDEMRKDISLAENEIGWAHYYKIKSIEIIES